jgi:hypothetical protein
MLEALNARYAGKDVDACLPEIVGALGEYDVETINYGAVTTCEYLNNRARVWFNAETGAIIVISIG